MQQYPQYPQQQVHVQHQRYFPQAQAAAPQPPALSPEQKLQQECRASLCRVLAALLLWFEFVLLAVELFSTGRLYGTVRDLPCLEATLLSSRKVDSYARDLLPPSNAVGRVSAYLLIALVLSTVSLVYFLVTLARFVRHSGGCSLGTPCAFATWWDARSGLEEEEEGKEAEHGKEAGERGREDMDSWCGDKESGNPLTGPRIYSVAGLVIGLLGYFGSGLYEWMTSSEEYFRTRYTTLGYVSLIFLVVSARHVAGMVGTVICCRRRQGACPCSGRQAFSNVIMGVIAIALYSANSRDAFPCDLPGYSYASPPPADHDPCGTRPQQEFASRSLGAYYAPVTASLFLVTSLGTVLSTSGAFTPAFACNATVGVARAPALSVSFDKYLASGALLALSPPALCPGAATAPQLPPALQAESGYSEGSVIHAWLGFRAPTAVEAGDARVTLQLLAGTAGVPYLPRPPLRWEENKYPPRQASASSSSSSSTPIPFGTGGRFTLSEAGDSLNPYRLASDTAASLCSGSGGGACKGNWSLADVPDLAGAGLQVSLGSFGGEAWVWRVEASSRVEITYAGLDMCAEKENLG
jgi:hypothetical protein